jgi:hypothetical protein
MLAQQRPSQTDQSGFYQVGGKALCLVDEPGNGAPSRWHIANILADGGCRNLFTHFRHHVSGYD